MTSLYNLTEQMIGLRNMMEDDDLPLTHDQLTDTLDGLSGEIEIKAENLMGYVSNLASDVDMIDIEIKRLTARKKVIKNRQDGLKRYLRDNMAAADIDKITCPLFSITLRKAPLVAITPSDPFEIPEKYHRTTVAINKTLVKQDLNAGIEIPGCKLLPGQRGLLIK